MNDFSKRLLILADHFRVSTPAAFAKKIGISHQSATNYLKGIRMPTLDVLLKIQESFEGLNIEWLLTGKGEMITGKVQNYDSVKDLEIDYLKQIVQSQKALIQVLSEKAGVDLTDLTDDQGTDKKEKSIIKGFGSFYSGRFKMLIQNMDLSYQ